MRICLPAATIPAMCRREQREHAAQAAAVSVAFARLAAALKVPGVSHHTFRPTGASVMVANGASLRGVQMIGGWTTLRMVERYAHLDDAELQRAVRLTHNHTEAATQGDTQGDTATGTADRKPEHANGEKA